VDILQRVWCSDLTRINSRILGATVNTITPRGNWPTNSQLTSARTHARTHTHTHTHIHAQLSANRPWPYGLRLISSYLVWEFQSDEKNLRYLLYVVTYRLRQAGILTSAMQHAALLEKPDNTHSSNLPYFVESKGSLTRSKDLVTGIYKYSYKVSSFSFRRDVNFIILPTPRPFNSSP
jgi:hypothetical protein